ncbi:MAG: replication protein C [Rhodobacteraceae bacterium]|nr:replication protein C [Paracoccaceae bacterium]
MAFSQATAPDGERYRGLLSADNGLPDRHVLVDTIRNAAPRLGLRAPVIATLDAMLSCLPPRRSHHTVFASNATLTFRRNGITDRTLRRHVALLQEAGLLRRHDSPNGKRYTRHSAVEGRALRFGFDLSPLFDRLHEIASMAAQTLREQERIAYLRCKVRAITGEMLRLDPQDEGALAARTALRRKLSLEQVQDLLACLPDKVTKAEGSATEDDHTPERMSASDGQNVRHHHSSNKEHTDKESAQPVEQVTKPAKVTVPELLASCPQAAEFSPRAIETVEDVIQHARTLAPMLGIRDSDVIAAQRRFGPYGVALTIWAIVEFHDRIKVVGAYFRALTTGAKSAGFDPGQLVRRLGAGRQCTA